MFMLERTLSSVLRCCVPLLSFVFTIACDRAASHEGGTLPFDAALSAPARRLEPLPEAESTPAAQRYAFQTPLPHPKPPPDAAVERYADLSTPSCLSQLRARKLPVKPARRRYAGMSAPVELHGPLHGVRFHVPRTIYGRLDCRLALLLDDWAKQLASEGVRAVHVNNMYRPGSSVAPKERGKPKKPSQHAAGLAIDVIAFELADGTRLDIEHDFHGVLGEPVCGPNSQVPAGHPKALRLRELTCQMAALGFCHHLYTPNRDQAHYNHLHCDLEAKNDYFDVR